MTKTSFLVSFFGGLTLCLVMYLLASARRWLGWMESRGIEAPSRGMELLSHRGASWRKGLSFASAWSIHPGLSATLFGAIGLLVHWGLGVSAVPSLYIAMVGSLTLTLCVATLTWRRLYEPEPHEAPASQQREHSAIPVISRSSRCISRTRQVEEGWRDGEAGLKSAKKGPCYCAPAPSHKPRQR